MRVLFLRNISLCGVIYQASESYVEVPLEMGNLPFFKALLSDGMAKLCQDDQPSTPQIMGDLSQDAPKVPKKRKDK